MDFKKENLKEVTTADKVTDLVIFEKGSSVPKIIKKSTYDDAVIDTNRTHYTYKAILTQTSTNAPVATVLYNDLPQGTPVWSYSSAGQYYCTLTGAFTSGKTFVMSGNSFNYVNVHGYVNTNAYWSDANQVWINTFRINLDAETDTGEYVNVEMINTPIWIEVYL